MKSWCIIEQSYRWLKLGDIEEDTGNTTISTQGQTFSTNYFKNNILEEGTDSK
jgi:hypothetical protein